MFTSECPHYSLALLSRFIRTCRLVPSRYLCVLGVREDWGLGWGARGLIPRACWACLNLTHHSDWVRVWRTCTFSKKIEFAWKRTLPIVPRSLSFSFSPASPQHKEASAEVYCGGESTMPDSFSCRHVELSGIVWTATVQNWNKSFTHIELHAGVVSQEDVENKIPVLKPEYLPPSQWILVLAPTYSLPQRSEYLLTLHQSVPQNLSNMWRSTFEISAAKLRSVTEIDITVLMCGHKTYLKRFSRRRKWCYPV